MHEPLHESLDPCCNIQLQASFFKTKDSFMYPILDFAPQQVNVRLEPHSCFEKRGCQMQILSHLYSWKTKNIMLLKYILMMSSIRNPFAYELQLFGGFQDFVHPR